MRTTDIADEELTKEEKEFIELYKRATISQHPKSYVQPIVSLGWNACVREAVRWIGEINSNKKLPYTILPKGFYLQEHTRRSMLLSYDRIFRETPNEN